MKHPPLRRRLIFWAVAAVAIVVAVLLVLVAIGDLRYGGSPNSSATLTVTRVQWTILQGTVNGSTSSGWFGPSHFNYTGADGYPLQTQSGGRFTIGVVLSVYGGSPRPIYSILAGSPFSVTSCHPSLPVTVPVDDDAGFDFTVQTPNSPGAFFALNITLNALTATSSVCPPP
ncbi:MAG: hypothetical protein WB788_03730 [Thermoplasmata archaeon]|nr:hypothetical protein [Thermoplasmata archaeon]